MNPVASPPSDLRPDLRHRLVGWLGAWIIRLLGSTWRIEWLEPSNVAAVDRIRERVVYSFWHEHILTFAYTHRGRGAVVLVSRHADGETISQIICRLGYGVVRGSTTRGGVRGLIGMVRVGRGELPLAVTPDGPRGPRRGLQPGLLEVAQRCRRPICPIAAEALRQTRLSSWDRFQLPHPWSRIAVAVGALIWIPAEATPEERETRWRREVEEGMAGVERRVEGWRRDRLGER